MSPQVTLEIAALQDKTVSQLVQRYEEVFKEECRSRNKQYLIRASLGGFRQTKKVDFHERPSKRHKNSPSMQTRE